MKGKPLGDRQRPGWGVIPNLYKVKQSTVHPPSINRASRWGEFPRGDMNKEAMVRQEQHHPPKQIKEVSGNSRGCFWDRQEDRQRAGTAIRRSSNPNETKCLSPNTKGWETEGRGGGHCMVGTCRAAVQLRNTTDSTWLLAQTNCRR